MEWLVGSNQHNTIVLFFFTYFAYLFGILLIYSSKTIQITTKNIIVCSLYLLRLLHIIS